MSVKNHISYSLTASAASQHQQIDAKAISWLSNDGANTITFNFEDDITGTGSTGSNFALLAGETVDIDQWITDLYYIATGGDTAFRVFGVAK